MSRILALTALAMIAFAANSLLCRLALRDTGIDPAGFTLIRLVSGALVLWLLLRARSTSVAGRHGDWPGALALFAYAIAFSYAYVGLSAGAGALLLFGSVQATMILHGLSRGERLRPWQCVGLALAVGGLVALVAPGASAPAALPSALMVLAGIAWGVYSLLGRGNADPLATTTGNFVRSVPLAVGAAALALPWLEFDVRGSVLAVLSGAFASGMGYAIWYAALRGLSATAAATVQLSVPALAALGGVALLAEPLTLRLVLASAATLGGIALVIHMRERRG
jgi:drug/metabolite transporter (DMT)-like permease